MHALLVLVHALAVLAGLIFGPIVLILPAWGYARRHHGATWALPLITLPALALWVLLNLTPFGAPKSLANGFIEPCVLGAGGVILAYIQVFLVDPRFRTPGRTTLHLSLGLASAAVALKFLVPFLPE
jgi:hypothetical protein